MRTFLHAVTLAAVVLVGSALVAFGLIQLQRERVVLTLSEWRCTRMEMDRGNGRCVVYERKGWR